MHAGLLDALHNETPPSEPAMSPTNKLHAAYEPISEAELLADGLIEPVSIPSSSSACKAALLIILGILFAKRREPLCGDIGCLKRAEWAIEPPGLVMHQRLQAKQHDMHCQTMHGTLLLLCVTR